MTAITNHSRRYLIAGAAFLGVAAGAYGVARYYPALGPIAGSIAPLCWKLGVVGAAISIVLGNIATIAVMIVQLQREYRRVRRPRRA